MTDGGDQTDGGVVSTGVKVKKILSVYANPPRCLQVFTLGTLLTDANEPGLQTLFVSGEKSPSD